MIGSVCCVAVLVGIAVSARAISAGQDTSAEGSLRLHAFRVGLGGFFLSYVGRLFQTLHGQPDWLVPTHRVLGVLAVVTMSALALACHLSARAPLTATWQEWRNHTRGERRGDLYTMWLLLASCAVILLLAPAYTIHSVLPVLHPPAVQVALAVAITPVFVWFGIVATLVGNQVAVAPEARTRIRFTCYSLMLWMTTRLLFDIVLGPSWAGWVDVGLMVDVVLIGSVTVLLVAASRRSIVEAMDRFGAEYVMGSMAEALVAVDTGGIVRVLNQSAERMIGQTRDEIVGKPAREVLDPARWTLANPGALHLPPDQLESIRGFKTPDGADQYVASRTAVLIDGMGAETGRVEILHDVTEYKEAQERLAEYSQVLEDRIADRSRALAESEERYRGLVEHLADCMLIVKHNTIRFANAAAEALWKDQFPTLTGRHDNDLWDVGIASPWADLRVRLAETPGSPWRGEMTWRVGPDDERSFLVTASTARWEGEPAILLLGSDNTERAKLQTSMDRVRRLQALGTLTGGIAHDFNNYLTSILGRLTMVEQLGLDSGPMQKNIERALDAAEKARQLITRLMRFSRPEHSGREPTEIGALLRDTEPLLESLVREEIRLEWHVPTDPVWADIDAAAIQEILLNLAKNADDAMRGAAGVLLVTARGNVGADGNSVQISVTDTGPGFTSEVREHLFVPFFTTKPVGQGHGLGLALAHQIMQEHGGTIDAESSPDRGATFRLTLAQCDPPAQSAQPATADIALVEGEGEVVLVVDDDGDVRQTASDMLSHLGYRVVTAPDGRRALDVANREPTIAAVLMDVVMPEMNGVDCAQALQDRGVTAPIIFMTGYDPDPARLQQLKGDHVVISKPFRMQQLAGVLSERIAAARAAA